MPFWPAGGHSADLKLRVFSALWRAGELLAAIKTIRFEVPFGALEGSRLGTYIAVPFGAQESFWLISKL